MRPGTDLLFAMALISLAAVPASASDCLPGYPRFRPGKVSIPADAAWRTPDGRSRIVGYNDMDEMLRPMAQLLERRDPRMRSELQLKGTRTAPPALIDGTSLFAPMGAEWEDAQAAAYRARYGSDPVMIRVAHDSLNPAARSSPVAVIVHRSSPLASLTMAEVKDLFTGTAAHPRANLALHPVGFAETTAIGQFLRKRVFAGAAFVPGYQGKPQSREVVDAVAADPQAIGLANINHVDARVRQVGLASGPGARPSFGTREDLQAGRYPLDRHLLAYARRGPDGKIEPAARAWFELMLSCEGQAIIAKGGLGYIPLSPAEAARERRSLD